MALKSKYAIPYNNSPQILKWGTPLTISSGTGNAANVVLGLSNFNSIRTGDQVQISGITGNTNANGIFYVKMVNQLQMALFSDKYLSTPIVGNGAFGGTGLISKVYYNYCTPYLSDEKISPSNNPKVNKPKYEVANNLIKLYPQDIPVLEVTIDYIRKPFPIYSNLATPSFYPIEVTDNTINLEDYYPKDFLIMIKDKAAETFLSEVRDSLGTQLQQNAIK
jgi:hypothetical protein